MRLKGTNPFIPSEHDEQAALFQWAALATAKHPELASLHSQPNARKATMAAMRFYKAEGLRNGVPDIRLGVKRGEFGALLIELKRRGELKSGEPVNFPDVEQAKWLRRENAAGNLAITCWGMEEAREAILAYLALPIPEINAERASEQREAVLGRASIRGDWRQIRLGDVDCATLRRRKSSRPTG